MLPAPSAVEITVEPFSHCLTLFDSVISCNWNSSECLQRCRPSFSSQTAGQQSEDVLWDAKELKWSRQQRVIKLGHSTAPKPHWHYSETSLASILYHYIIFGVSPLMCLSPHKSSVMTPLWESPYNLIMQCSSCCPYFCDKKCRTSMSFQPWVELTRQHHLYCIVK